MYTKNELAVRVLCPSSSGREETVYVLGIPHGLTFEPKWVNGCANMNGSRCCASCISALLRRLQEDPALLEAQPISPTRESS